MLSEREKNPPYSISRKIRRLATGFYLKYDFHKTEFLENNHKRARGLWQCKRSRSRSEDCQQTVSAEDDTERNEKILKNFRSYLAKVPFKRGLVEIY